MQKNSQTNNLEAAQDKVANLLNSEIIPDKNLAKFTSWKIGGSAKHYFCPRNIDELALYLKSLHRQEEILFLGLGSNVLIRDGGFNGSVIHLFKTISDISIIDNKSVLEQLGIIKEENFVVIKIEAGVTCAKIAKFCEKHALYGGEFFAGIPGTMGGALAMNAGAFGSETWQFVEKVEVISRTGKIIFRDKLDFEVSYRSVKNLSAEDEYFLAGYLVFHKISNYNYVDKPISNLDNNGNDLDNKNNAGSNKIKQLLQKRNESQPIGQLTCGSVFKNPPNNYAAKLIESSKLKGKRIGNAMVSNKHANFIVNLGNASSNDVESLIDLIKTTVYQDSGVKLELEVKIIGNKIGEL